MSQSATKLDRRTDVKLDAEKHSITMPLPTGYEYHSSNRKMRSEGSRKVHIKVANVNDLEKWFSKFKHDSQTTWRVAKTYPAGDNRTEYKIDYRCQHNTMSRSETADSRKLSKNTQCPAVLTLCLRRKTDLNPKRIQEDFIIKGFLGSCTFSGIHNHATHSADALRHKDVGHETDQRLRKLYENGHSPSSAWDFIQSELFDSNTDEEYLVKSADRSLCPDLQYCYRYYYKMFEMEYGEKSDKSVAENLKNNTLKYNEQFQQECVKSEVWEDKTIIAVCTPVMQRIHKMCPNAGELVFIDSSGSLDKENHRVFMLLTHSAGGGLPLGCFITSSESQSAITHGLKLLLSIIDQPFYDKGYPDVFMTDDCSAERNAIQTVFPNSKRMLCTFHVLQAVWRWLHDSSHGVNNMNRPEVMANVKSMMYAKDEALLENAYQKLKELHHVAANQLLLNYLHKYYQRREEWCLLYRGISNRGHNTNNHVESGFRILKERIFHRLKAYNLTQLTDFIVHRWSDHYVRKLIDISNNRYKPYMYGLRTFPASTITKEDIQEVESSDASTCMMFRVSCGSNSYLVDMEAGVCSCGVGLRGAMCVHQLSCAKHFDWSSFNILPYYHEELRKLYYTIASGIEEQSGVEWFEPLKARTPHSQTPTSKTQTRTVTDTPRTVKHDVPQCFSTDEITGEDFDQQIDDFANKLKSVSRDSQFIGPLSLFFSQNKRIKTDSQLASALATFGKSSSSGGSLLSPISIPTNCGARGNRGRPKRKVAQFDHGYSKSGAKRARAPHSLSECVTKNIPIGKK